MKNTSEIIFDGQPEQFRLGYNWKASEMSDDLIKILDDQMKMLRHFNSMYIYLFSHIFDTMLNDDQRKEIAEMLKNYDAANNPA